MREFTRDQLIFVVDSMLIGALDQCEGEDGEFGPYTNGAIESAGMAIATLYVQLTGDSDGLGIHDALAWAGNFYEAVHSGNPVVTSKHAERFIDGLFFDYLRG